MYYLNWYKLQHFTITVLAVITMRATQVEACHFINSEKSTHKAVRENMVIKE